MNTYRHIWMDSSNGYGLNQCPLKANMWKVLSPAHDTIRGEGPSLIGNHAGMSLKFTLRPWTQLPFKLPSYHEVSSFCHVFLPWHTVSKQPQNNRLTHHRLKSTKWWTKINLLSFKFGFLRYCFIAPQSKLTQ